VVLLLLLPRSGGVSIGRLALAGGLSGINLLELPSDHRPF